MTSKAELKKLYRAREAARVLSGELTKWIVVLSTVIAQAECELIEQTRGGKKRKTKSTR